MSNLLNLIQELKNLGFTKENSEEVLKIAEQEIINSVIEDFALNADEKVVEEYLQKFSSAQNNVEQLTNLLHEIMAIQYGQENIKAKKEELLTKYLKDVVLLTKQTKETYQKYTQGDPEAIKIVEEAKNNPAIKSFVEQLQDNG
jgi:hypothetical protein